MIKRILLPLSIILLGALLLASSERLSKKTSSQAVAIEAQADSKNIESEGVAKRNAIRKKLNEANLLKQDELQKVYKNIDELSQVSSELKVIKQSPALKSTYMAKQKLADKIKGSHNLDNHNTTTRECEAGTVDDCSGDGDCCPESWIGDGFEDCEDQAYGCDLTCYDNDGGDCTGGGDGGSDGGGDGGCEAGTVDDCSGDGDCCPESWIGDGFADCEDQAYGCDLTCYDNDGGDCAGGGDGGGSDGGSEECSDCAYDFTPYGSECCDTAWYEYGIDCATLESNYYWDCSGCECPGDNGGGDGGGDDGGDGGCEAGTVDDCSGDGDCCPESWIGDGYADCEDQAYGCDLTCYDNDGGDCDGGGDGGGDDGGTEECSDCLYDFTPYGSECCDTAWYEYGIDCATLESNYYWDCSGCGCPGDGDPVCGDGVCNGDETYESCPEDCNEPGTCDPGYVVDCDGTGECWPESWIGDGYGDCQDQEYGADLTCYDCDGGDCPDSDPGCSDTGEEYGCTDPDACNYDPEATMDDGSCAEFDECGECGGDGPSVMCDDGSYVCDASDCPQPEPDVYIIAGDATVDGNMAYVSLSYESAVDIAGIQFTISDEPDVAMAVSFDADDDVFMASANDAGGDVTGVFFSISGASLPPTDGAAQFAVLTYELSEELDAGDTVGLHFTDVVCSSPAGTSVPAAGVDGSISSSSGTPGDVNGDGAINVQDIILVVNLILDGGHNDLADVNGDGSINVQDIILIVNMILDSRTQDASEAEIIRTNNELILKADGFIGAVQMILTHDNNFALKLTKNAMVADYRSSGNTTTLIVVVPEDEVIFTHNGDYEIAELMVVNGSNEIAVSTPAVFSLGAAYPNPFNPATSIALDISEAGNVNVTVYNLMGQGVATLAEGYMQPGVYHLNWDASQEVSGMYLVRAEAGGFISTQKLLLIK